MSQALVPELGVTDWQVSRRFYCDLLGFACLYERPEERFSYLALGQAELMIDQLHQTRSFLIDGAPLVAPLGRGMNLQIRVAQLAPILARLEAAGWPLHLPLEEKWYRKNETEVGNRQMIVADPDGYLLRLYEDLGARAIRK